MAQSLRTASTIPITPTDFSFATLIGVRESPVVSGEPNVTAEPIPQQYLYEQLDTIIPDLPAIIDTNVTTTPSTVQTKNLQSTEPGPETSIGRVAGPLGPEAHVTVVENLADDSDSDDMEDAPRFSGDPWTEDPDQFWRDVRLFFRKVDVDKRCADFDLLLAANSAADKWHRKLPAVIRDDWDALEKAFRTQWIRAPPPRLSDAEALEVILRGVPTLDDLTKYDSVARGGPSTARYQLWIRKLYNDAMVEEYSDGLADQVRSKLPRPLRDLIEPVQTWKELLDGVCAVNTTRLRERVRDAIEDSKKRNKIRTVVAQRIDIDPERGNVRGAAGTTTLDSLGQQPAALSLRVQHDPMTAFASPPNPTTYPQWGWGPLQYPPSGHSSYTPRAPQAPWAPGSPLGPVHEYIYHTTGF